MKKMKHVLPLLALLVAPQLVLAQPIPSRALCGKQPLPDARDLLAHLFDVYDGAKSFQGDFELDALYSPNGKFAKHQHYNIQTAWRCNEKGDKERDFTRLVNTLNSGVEEKRQTIEWHDDGQNATGVWVEQNVWNRSERNPAPVFEQLLKSTVQSLALSISTGVDSSPGASFKVERGRQGGRDVWIIRSKPDAAFRVVVDAQTRALRVLTFSFQGLNLSLRGSNQVFDAPLSDSLFARKAAPNAREAKAGEIQFLEFFGVNFDTNKH